MLFTSLNTDEENFEVADESSQSSDKVVSDLEAMKHLMAAVIVPAMKAKRLRIFGNSSDQEYLPTSTTTSEEALAVMDDFLSTNSNHRMVLTLDGDYPQVETILTEHVFNDDAIEFWKFAGACSLSMQPNDLMASFMLLRRAIQKFPYEDAVPFIPHYVTRIVGLLGTIGMDKKSKDTYAKYFARIHAIESIAFSAMVLRDGWTKSGIVPFCLDTLLGQCAHWLKLTDVQKDIVIGGIEVLSRDTEFNGIVDESKLAALIQQTRPDLATEIMLLKDKVVNQQRSVWLNKPDVIMKRAEQKELQRQGLREKEEAKRIAEQKKEAVNAAKLAQDAGYIHVGGIIQEGQICMIATCRAVYTTVTKNKNPWKYCGICKYWFCPKQGCSKGYFCHLPKCAEFYK